MPNLKNFAQGQTLTGNTSDATAISLKAGQGVRFPEPPFQAVWWNETDFPNPANDDFREIVQVTGVSGDVLTVTRGQEDTVASSKNIAGKSYTIAAVVTAQIMSEFLTGSPSGGTFRIKDGKFLQIFDQGATVSGWRTMWLVDGQPVYGELDNGTSGEVGANSTRVRNGVFQVYNADTGKWHALFVTGDVGQAQVTLGPEED